MKSPGVGRIKAKEVAPAVCADVCIVTWLLPLAECLICPAETLPGELK